MTTTKKIRPIENPISRYRFTKPGDFPKTIRPGRDEPLRLADFKPPDSVVEERRGVRYPKDTRAELEKRAIPIETVYGSIYERIIYKTLLIKKIPFSFQSSLQGGRMELGGLAADFVLLDRPQIIEPHGRFWHAGYVSRIRDERRADLLEGMGFVVTYIWDYEIEPESIYNEWMRRNVDLRVPGQLPREALGLRPSTWQGA